MVEVKRMLLNKREACEYLGGISTKTLEREKGKGRIKAVRIAGRVLFRPDDLDTYILKNLDR